MINPISPKTSVIYSDRPVNTEQKTTPSGAPEQNQRPSSAEQPRLEYRASSSFNQTKTSGVEAYKAVDETKESANPYASTVLRFIDLQLQRDKAAGASEEELQSRLEAGLDGFIKGYSEAFEQLSAMGVLEGEVKTAIEDTYNRVLEGITAMAEANGLKTPVEEGDLLPVSSSGEGQAAPAAPVAMEPLKPAAELDRLRATDQSDLELIQQLVKLQPKVAFEPAQNARLSSSIENAVGSSYKVNETRDFDFKVRTAEGDEVTVRISADRAAQAQLNGTAGDQKLRVGDQSSSVSFSVEGELSEKETQAITSLLEKVNDISDAFFSGKFERAFDMASNFRLEGDQIQSFSLNLQMTKTEQTSSEQGLYTPQSVGRGAERGQFESFANRLKEAADLAEQLGQPRTLVSDLLAYLAEQKHPEHPRAELLGGVAKQLL